ncbi:hypothetical protein B0H14DRAFT_2677352, partial [Mycena olivaceomarginata]
MSGLPALVSLTVFLGTPATYQVADVRCHSVQTVARSVLNDEHCNLHHPPISITILTPRATQMELRPLQDVQQILMPEQSLTRLSLLI